MLYMSYILELCVYGSSWFIHVGKILNVIIKFSHIFSYFLITMSVGIKWEFWANIKIIAPAGAISITRPSPQPPPSTLPPQHNPLANLT